MTPRVSICVPNLNTRPFLPERFRTIREQSFEDWELLVYDSYSDDGAWEFISDLARSEPRMRAWQGPREGTPGSWNPCIHAARGDYVYVATSDDTMPSDCLDKLVGALDAHPECDLAHCSLRPIDAQGKDVESIANWWRTRSSFATSSGPLLGSVHVRRAPFDGLLHLRGESVYTSITQLLIRRSLFSRIGYFEPTWGSVGDFEWDMRAGLTANTVHVPGTWGGWRVHGGQATAGAGLGSDEHARRIEGMIEHALETCRSSMPPHLDRRLESRCRAAATDFRRFEREFDRCRNAFERRSLIARRLAGGSIAARRHVWSKAFGATPWPDLWPRWVAALLEEKGAGPPLTAATQMQANHSTQRAGMVSTELEPTL